MKQIEPGTKVAGLDIGKHWLDLGLCDGQTHLRFANTMAGIAELIRQVQEWAVERIGLEASGNYERDVREALEAAGLEVVMFQPIEVRAFARWHRLRAKSDKADAYLIALATKAYKGTASRRAPEQAELSELLTVYEQISDLLAKSKTQSEHDRLTDSKALRAQIGACLRQAKAQALELIMQRVRQRPDLLKRFELLKSLPGVGQVVALALLIRMPELGHMSPKKPAALLGVAPFDHDSGMMRGRRFIAGGRARPRAFVYIAALAAKCMDTPFRTFAQRLAKNGKPPKIIIVVVMRKLIEAANAVLWRQTLWEKST